MIFICLSVAFIIADTFGERLTKTENEQIQQICGTAMKRQKLMNGIRADASDAPWAVPINVKGKNGVMHCSGTLVSPRHVITARHCFLNDFANGAYTYVTDSREIDKRNCMNDDYVMTRGSETTEVHFSTECRSRDACNKAKMSRDLVTRNAARVVLPGVCSDESPDSFDHEDFAIVILDRDVLFSERISPACIPRTSEGIQQGSRLTTFGFGFDPTDQHVSNGVLRYETVKIENCDLKHYICSVSLNGIQLACRGDSGAGSVLEVNSRTTVVAVLSGGEECDLGLKNSFDYMTPVVKYKDSICMHTGICMTYKAKAKHDVSHLHGEEEPLKKGKEDRGHLNYNSLVILFLLKYLF